MLPPVVLHVPSSDFQLPLAKRVSYREVALSSVSVDPNRPNSVSKPHDTLERINSYVKYIILFAYSKLERYIEYTQSHQHLNISVTELQQLWPTETFYVYSISCGRLLRLS